MAIKNVKDATSAVAAMQSTVRAVADKNGGKVELKELAARKETGWLASRLAHDYGTNVRGRCGGSGKATVWVPDPNGTETVFEPAKELTSAQVAKVLGELRQAEELIQKADTGGAGLLGRGPDGKLSDTEAGTLNASKATLAQEAAVRAVGAAPDQRSGLGSLIDRLKG